jgi:hypothetical protein
MQNMCRERCFQHIFALGASKPAAILESVNIDSVDYLRIELIAGATAGDFSVSLRDERNGETTGAARTYMPECPRENDWLPALAPPRWTSLETQLGCEYGLGVKDQADFCYTISIGDLNVICLATCHHLVARNTNVP